MCRTNLMLLDALGYWLDVGFAKVCCGDQQSSRDRHLQHCSRPVSLWWVLKGLLMRYYRLFEISGGKLEPAVQSSSVNEFLHASHILQHWFLKRKGSKWLKTNTWIFSSSVSLRDQWCGTNRGQAHNYRPGTITENNWSIPAQFYICRSASQQSGRYLYGIFS